MFLNREPAGFLGHLDRRAARERTQALLDEIGIELDVDRKVEELSVVQQQVVEIVKALSVTASVLIMDEPSAALTDKELRKLFEIIRTLTARGVTVIYISHMLEEVFEIADRVTVLKDGRVTGTRPAGELTREDLVRMMVGRTIEDYFPPLGGEREGRRSWRCAASPGAGASRTSASSCTRGRSSAWPAWWARAGTCSPGASSAWSRYDAGEIVVKGGRPPRDFHDAMASGFGYITDDRKAQGILGPMSIQENVTIANLPSYLSLGFLRRGREKADCAPAGRRCSPSRRRASARPSRP